MLSVVEAYAAEYVHIRLREGTQELLYCDHLVGDHCRSRDVVEVAALKNPRA